MSRSEAAKSGLLEDLEDTVLMIEGISVDIVSDMATNIVRGPLIRYPNLTNPNVQHEIHDGRKQIDITYTNMGLHGFFSWLSKHYSAAHVFVECKNYGKEVGNPELDQLSSRFSPSRGQVGLLVCRSFQNKPLFLKRCIDTAKDSRGFVIPLDDNDLAALTTTRQDDVLFANWKLLKDKFDALIN